MGRKKDMGLFDTVLNEFVYTAIYKASLEEKRALPDRYLKIALSETRSKNFASNSSKEEKELMLSHLGYTFCYIFNGNSPRMKLIQQMVPALQTGKRSTVGKQISESNVYVTTDRELLRTLGLMSNTVHNPSYFMDLEVLRQGYHTQKWSKRYSVEKDKIYRDLDEMSRKLANLFLNSILFMRSAKDMIGITESALQILVALYSHHSISPTDDQLRTLFYGRMAKKSFGDAIRSLMHEGLIQRTSGEISITGLGIKKVNNFMYSVIHSNNF